LSDQENAPQEGEELKQEDVEGHRLVPRTVNEAEEGDKTGEADVEAHRYPPDRTVPS
jgi:hypothetical protein